MVLRTCPKCGMNLTVEYKKPLSSVIKKIYCFTCGFEVLGG